MHLVIDRNALCGNRPIPAVSKDFRFSANTIRLRIAKENAFRTCMDQLRILESAIMDKLFRTYVRKRKQLPRSIYRSSGMNTNKIIFFNVRRQSVEPIHQIPIQRAIFPRKIGCPAAYIPHNPCSCSLYPYWKYKHNRLKFPFHWHAE